MGKAPISLRCQIGILEKSSVGHEEIGADGVSDVFQRLFLGIPLAMTAGESRTMDIVPEFAFMDDKGISHG